MTFRRITIPFYFIYLLLLIQVGCQKNVDKNIKDPIVIAMAGPISGDASKTGMAMKQGIELYFNEINDKQGGIDGRFLKLDLYDDKNINGFEIGKQIISKSNALAVIGHWKSSCSRDAAPLYKLNKIPAVSPGSTDISYTLDNEWYFRTVFKDYAQGIHLSNYAIKVLDHLVVNIIYDKKSDYLVSTLEAWAAKNIIKINFKKEISNKQNIDYKKIIHDLQKNTSLLKFDRQSFHQLKGKIPKTIIDKLQTIKNVTFTNKEELLNKISELISKKDVDKYSSFLLKCAGYDSLIFLSIYATDGVKFLKLMQDYGITNPILARDSFDSHTFKGSVKKFDVNIKNKIYILTHMLFDSANEEAQNFRKMYYNRYNDYPDWIAANSYDTAKVVVRAINDSHIKWKIDSLEKKRENIRNSLENINNLDVSVKGITGKIYFDKQGDSVDKPIMVGIFNGKDIISAFTQLHSISYLNPTDKLLQTKDQNLKYKSIKYTNVVYTGIELNDICNFDPKNRSVHLDFYLWFRYGRKINPGEIKFINAIQPEPDLTISNSSLSLDKLNTSVSVKLVEDNIDNDNKNEFDKFYYRLYHVKGRFKAFYQPGNNVYEKYKLGFKFRHKELTRDNLIYVIDFLGMDLNEEQDYFEISENKSFKDSIDGWKITESSFSQDTMIKKTLGGMSNINIPFEFSIFTFSLTIENDDLIKIRRVFSGSYLNCLLIACFLLIIPFYYFYYKYRKLIICLCLYTLSYAFVVILEIVLIDCFKANATSYQLSLIIKMIDILLFTLTAFLLHSLLNFLLTYVTGKVRTYKIPSILSKLIVFIIYFITLCCIFIFVLEYDITKYLAFGTIFIMIIGIAIETNISDYISGVLLSIDGLFIKKDYIKIGNAEGEVLRRDLRSTKILTNEKCVISIPNSKVMSLFVENYTKSYKDEIIYPKIEINMSFHPKYYYEDIKEILLSGIKSIDEVKQDKDYFPSVDIKTIAENSITYTITFFPKNYLQKDIILQQVKKKIWEKLKDNNILIA